MGRKNVKNCWFGLPIFLGGPLGSHLSGVGPCSLGACSCPHVLNKYSHICITIALLLQISKTWIDHPLNPWPPLEPLITRWVHHCPLSPSPPVGSIYSTQGPNGCSKFPLTKRIAAIGPPRKIRNAWGHEVFSSYESRHCQHFGRHGFWFWESIFSGIPNISILRFQKSWPSLSLEAISSIVPWPQTSISANWCCLF